MTRFNKYMEYRSSGGFKSYEEWLHWRGLKYRNLRRGIALIMMAITIIVLI